MRPKTVNASELSTIKMVAGGEKRYPVVIDEGIVIRWVGFGWVDEGKATDKAFKKYPVVTREKSK